MLVIQNLTKQYKPGQAVFSDINFRFEEGKCIGLEGPNGSGKTTFLRICSINSFPTSGEVLFRGMDIHESPGKYLSHVGLVHDEESLPNYLTAEELLEWILRQRKLWSKESPGAIQSMLETLELEAGDELIGTYSTGMKKKTQIAAAFIVEPEVLILDEPFRGLDQSSRKKVIELLRHAKSKNTLILLASHSEISGSEFFDEVIRFPI
jgi:ABC-type multidrug transport system ATPase subunit